VIETGETNGSAATAARALDGVEEERFLLLFGDTLIEREDLSALAEAPGDDVAVLTAPLAGEDSRGWICARVRDGRIEEIWGHPREFPEGHRLHGFSATKELIPYLENCPDLFPRTQVGMMPPVETYVEAAAETYRADGNTLRAVAARRPVFDIDKPWHILEANRHVVKSLTGALAENQLAENASIHPSAQIDGFVSLGKNSRLGPNVRVRGSLIVDDDTVIDNGAIIDGDAVIGNDCLVTNYCYLGDASTLGDRCVMNHCAELTGMAMENVYLFHYMEFYGILGMNTDLGAATVCGTLRYDDGPTAHRVKGRREEPLHYSCACFLGDFSRTGVNAIIMPGKKTGVYSIVGAGVVLNEDLPDRTSLSVKQEHERRPWGPERYGW
jgi:bifunctional UDP-N-acetylglucosamine pyrophosphorylase/glucosamine-1-phosphate N-acetyltransferase